MRVPLALGSVRLVTRRLAALLLFAVLSQSARGQDQPWLEHALDLPIEKSRYVYQAWTMDDGLPQNSVLAMAQTREGYLWLGTFGGLVRFDGVRFKSYDITNTAELASNRILALHEDRRGDLWIGTRDGGLLRYRSDRFRAFGQAQGLPSADVRAIAEDALGNLWLGTGRGLVLWSQGRARRVLSEREGLPDDEVNAVLADSRGAIWAGTVKGLARYQDGGFSVFKAEDGLGSDSVSALYEDSRGSLWVGLDNGLVRRVGNGWRTYRAHADVLEGRVFSILEDRQGDLWVGASNKVIRWPGAVGGQKVEPDRISYYEPFGSNVSAIARITLQDREGNLWFGSDGNGLSRWRNTPLVTITHRKEDLPGAGVVPILSDGSGGMWLGPGCGGLYRWQEGKLARLRMPSGRRDIVCVRSLLVDSGRSLWVGHDRMLTRIDSDGVAQFDEADGLPGAQNTALLEDPAAGIWIGTAKGLALLGPEGVLRFSQADGLISDDIRSLALAPDGELWIGTGGGISRYSRGEFRSLTPEKDLPEKDLCKGAVRDIHFDSRGVAWIATYGGGLSRHHEGSTVCITRNRGLFDNAISRIIPDDHGYLWFNADHGVFKASFESLDAVADDILSDQQGARVQCLSFGPVDGAKEGNGGTQPAGSKAADGRIWFPNIEGISIVDPVGALFGQEPPATLIEGVLINDAPVPFQDSLVVPPGRRDFEVRYTGLGFSAPENLTFQYRLLGYDSDWKDAGTRRRAVYTNLDPDEYQFQVEACNPDGVCSSETAQVSILFQPALYETAWFQALVSLAVLGALAAGHRIRAKGIESRNLELRQQIDERMRIEKALRASEERFRGTFEQAAVGIAHLDLHGRWLRVNRKLCQIMVRSQDELAEALPLDELRPQRERILQGAAQMTACEWATLRGSGSPVWINITLSLVRSDEGRPSYFVMVVEDVTERKKLDILLRQTQEMARVGGWELDPEEGRLTWTDEVYRIHGLPLSKPIDWETALDFYHPESRPQAAEAFERGIESGDRWDREFRLLTSQRRLIWVRIICRPQMRKGRAFRLAGTMQDITELKLAEEALHKRERQQAVVAQLGQSALSGIQAGELMARAVGLAARNLQVDLCRILERSQDRRRLIVRAQTDVRNKTRSGAGFPLESDSQAAFTLRSSEPVVSENLHQEERFKPCSRLLEQGVVSSLSVLIGEPRDPFGVLETHSIHLRSFSQDDIHFVQSVANIIAESGNRQRVQRALEEANQSLERRVRERTSDLEALNRDLESFTSSVSHDLRAPIRHISSFSQLLLEEDGKPLPPGLRHYVEVIARSARKMGEQIDDLLSLSRLGRQPLRKEQVDCRWLVEELWKDVKRRERVEHVRFELGRLPPADADPGLLRHVWSNLIENSLKYSSKNARPRISISAHRRDGRTWYRVEDNGVGFDQAYAHRVFEVFQRLHGEDEFPGTGVGLSIVQRIVEKHRGEIIARGEVGQGACFEFSLEPAPSAAERKLAG